MALSTRAGSMRRNGARSIQSHADWITPIFHRGNAPICFDNAHVPKRARAWRVRGEGEFHALQLRSQLALFSATVVDKQTTLCRWAQVPVLSDAANRRLVKAETTRPLALISRRALG